MSQVSVWGERVPCEGLSREDIEYLSSLPAELPAVEWVWQEMDRIWRFYRLDNRKPLAAQAIADYYRHPVWLMNGLFTKVDPLSEKHRMAIAGHLALLGAQKIADYGGGSGVLALAISRRVLCSSVYVVEPYLSQLALQRLMREPRIQVAADLGAGGYDAIVAQDVLEHVEDPVLLAHQIANAVQLNGVVIFANCFRPVTLCHLPATFHLRHTFVWVMRAMGLRYIGVVEDAEHAQLFRRIGPIRLDKARRAERISRLIGPALNVVLSVSSRVVRTLRH